MPNSQPPNGSAQSNENGNSRSNGRGTDATGNNNRLVIAPSVSLPKGSSAIHGLGEKINADPVTDTDSMPIPIATSPGRSDFEPQLNLAYDSGSGNGPFGFGWSLAIPAITRKTDKSLPQYLDAVEPDASIRSIAEDLFSRYSRRMRRAITSSTNIKRNRQPLIN